MSSHDIPSPPFVIPKASTTLLPAQPFADLLGSPVVGPADIETTTLGAAYAAGLATGAWSEAEILASGHRDKATIFRPKVDEAQRKRRCESWCKAVSRSFDLADLSL